jgi:hypothetical protein
VTQVVRSGGGTYAVTIRHENRERVVYVTPEGTILQAPSSTTVQQPSTTASVLQGIGRVGLIAAAMLGALFAAFVMLAILQRRSASVLITGALVLTVGWFFARIYLWFFEPIYRGAGSVRPRSKR